MTGRSDEWRDLARRQAGDVVLAVGAFISIKILNKIDEHEKYE